MPLDMESEFYKMAKDILSRPKNFYKVFALSPKTGRLSLMGADGGIIVGPRLMNYFIEGPEKRAYKYGKTVSGDLFGALIKEFDEEVENLPPKKLVELGTALARTLGWGEFKVIKVSERRGEVVIEGSETIEMNTKDPPHHQLTCGFVTGLVQISMKRPMTGSIESAGRKKIRMSFGPMD
ncbi:MAG: hypothetical protein ACMUIG_06885 [Thermoplasmatota archaeon]